MIDKMSHNNKQTVAQHNKLINSHFELGIYEVKLFLFLLTKVRKEDFDFRLEKIPVEFFKNEGGNILYKDIMNAADKIVSRKFAIESDEGFDYIPLMARCSYKKGEGYIQAMFNQEVKPYLLQLKGNFTISQLSELLKLKSYHSHRIYWLLKQCSTFGERTILLGDLKSLLGLKGKYAKSKDFKKRILVKAQEELANTDMAFDFEEIRNGLKVESIRFKIIKPNKQDGSPEAYLNIGISQDINRAYTDREKLLKKRLKELELTDRQVRLIIERVGADAESGIWKLINDIKMNIRDGKIKENLGAYSAKKMDIKYNLGFFR